MGCWTEDVTDGGKAVKNEPRDTPAGVFLQLAAKGSWHLESTFIQQVFAERFLCSALYARYLGYTVPACIYQSPGSKQNSSQIAQTRAFSIT